MRVPLTILSFFITLATFAQQTTHDSAKSKVQKSYHLSHLKKELVGTWYKGMCSGAEVYANTFSFYADGTFKYGLDATTPNPLSTINGRYEIISDTGNSFVLRLKVTSITINTEYTIDAGGNAPEPGIFGYNGWHPKTILQKDSTFHDHILKIFKTVKANNDADFACPSIQIDLLEMYYKISDNKGYEQK